MGYGAVMKPLKKPMRRWVAACPVRYWNQYVVKGRTKAEALKNLRAGIVEEPLDGEVGDEGVGTIVRELL